MYYVEGNRIECRKGDSYTLRPQNPSHLFAFKSFVKNAHSLNVNYIKIYKPRYARALDILGGGGVSRLKKCAFGKR